MQVTADNRKSGTDIGALQWHMHACMRAMERGDRAATGAGCADVPVFRSGCG